MRLPACPRWVRAAVGLMYAAILLRLTVLKSPELWWYAFHGGGSPQPLIWQWRFAVNLVPFRTIAQYLAGEPSAVIAFRNLVGNLLLFVPWGVLWVWSRPQKARAAVAVGTAFLACFALETAQFLLRAGSWDVDDLLLNTLGAYLGYGVARFLWLRLRRQGSDSLQA